MVNIIKTSPGPQADLDIEKNKKKGTYRLPNVLNTLQSDFHDKCYLCESKNLTNIDIEHLRPHKNDIDKKFDWNNLFYSCKHCNGVKLSVAEFDNILDCTDNSKLVEEWIKYEVSPLVGSDVKLSPAVRKTKEITSTINLLNKIYNGDHTIHKKLESQNLRTLLIDDIFKFYGLLNRYSTHGIDSDEKQHLEYRIKSNIKKSAQFAAFKRWIIKSNALYNNEFGSYIASN